MSVLLLLSHATRRDAHGDEATNGVALKFRWSPLGGAMLHNSWRACSETESEFRRVEAGPESALAK